MNRRIRKILSLLVAVLMIMSAVPMSSFALTMCDVIGHDVEMVVTKEATCTEAGLKTEKCTRSNCDYSTGITEVIAYKSHTIATIDAVSPTCGKTGNTAGAYCSVCDLITVPCETIPALGHTLVDFPAVQPTCGVNGMNAGKKCSICNEVITGGEPIIASGHDYKQVSFTAGSCKTGTPTVEVKKCKICGDTKTTSKAAECDFGAWVTQSMATCSVNGKMTRTCAECGAKEEKIIDKTPHTEVVVNAVDATCTKPGNTAGKKCVVCNEITQGCEIIPASHQADWEIVSDSTCTATGERKGFCYICEKNVVENTPMKDHEFKYFLGQPSSCYNNGWELVRCHNCGFEFERVIEAEHDFESWVTVSMATCTTTGKMTRTCSECGATEEKTIDKTPHTEVVVIAEAATCDKAGKNAGKKCTVCGAVTQGCETIPALGHREKVVAGYAAACGKKGLSDGTYCEVCNKEIRPQVEIAALDHIIEIDRTASINPTCTTDGYKVEKCVRVGCGYTNNVVLPKTHGEGLKVVRDATCTEEGKKSGYCRSCNQTVVETIAPLGHLVTSELSWIVLDSPSCNKEGKKVATCARCGGQAVEAIPTLKHQEVVYTPAKPATCKEEGATESRQCTICKTITVKSERIEKLPHTFSKWTETKTATCKEAGLKEAVCTVCNEKVLASIDRLPHTEVVVVAKAATCINSGSHAGKKCTVCGDITQGCAIIPALGHNYIKDEIRSVEPTCELEGKFYGTCDRCGDVKDELLPAMGHYEEVIPGTPADCTLGGVSDCKWCTVCGAITAEPQQTEPLGHDFVLNLIKSKPATCLQNGYDYLQCTRCKATDTRETASNGHSYKQNWQTVVAPTCTQTGVAIKICKDCLTIETNTVDVMSHTDVNFDGKCDMCGITGGSVTEACSCNCHKSGLANMFFKFMLFFQKIFRANATCKCGQAHY